jgi:hypothetical protein
MPRAPGKRGKHREGRKGANRQVLPSLQAISSVWRAACRIKQLAEAEDKNPPSPHVRLPPVKPMRRDACLSLWSARPAAARSVPARPEDPDERSVLTASSHAGPARRGKSRASCTAVWSGDQAATRGAPGRAGGFPAARGSPPLRGGVCDAVAGYRAVGEGTQPNTLWSACHEEGLYHRPGREDL